MAEQTSKNKDFNMVVSLVKTQIRGERRFNADGIGHCIPALTALIDKYDWIPQRSAAIPASDPPLTASAGKSLARMSPRDPRMDDRANGIQASPTNYVHDSVHTTYSKPQHQASRPPPMAAPIREQVETPRRDEDDGRVSCEYCGRGFAPDRIDKHRQVCNKHPDKIAKAAKRGQLDMTAKRVGDLMDEKGKPKGKPRR
ncbi:Hypothetical protein DHA2_8657 [Giardia duodenalis]|uniref:C2HC/C3H-type domain-containing protein n=1 Tax=Giardia intestinalis TaxID=5741 RepID=V6T8K0_GIAIN|nr:Hypothetical protein DHA2_8657 [Giardia intestinalis]